MVPRDESLVVGRHGSGSKLQAAGVARAGSWALHPVLQAQSREKNDNSNYNKIQVV